MSLLDSKRVLVTGAGGFLGKHVVRKLEEAGAEVVPFRGDLLLGVKFQNPAYVDTLVGIDLVIHLAGDVAGAVPNREQPWRFLRNNSFLALHGIDLALWLKVPLVAAGSVCAYPEDAPVPFQEKDFWMGLPDRANLGYGIAKRLLSGALECAYRQEGLRYVHLISANLYGPGDHFSALGHVIPGLIMRIEEARMLEDPAVVVWGTGKPTRDFLYVEDAADAYVAAAEYLLLDGGPLQCNIGSGYEISIGFLANEIRLLSGYEGEIVFAPSKPDGQMRRLIDSSRAEKFLGWKAKTRLGDGLGRTIEWYRENFA